MFKPGQSGNLNGRPKGTPSEATVMFMELKNVAAKSWLTVWKRWMECIEDKERWAIELYVDKFTKGSKNDGEPRVFVGDITATTLEEMSAALLSKIPQFGMLTLPEILECYRAVNAVKDKVSTETLDNSVRTGADALFKQLDNISEVIEIKRALEPPR